MTEVVLDDGAHELCECGHYFNETHLTPGTECFVIGCQCSMFRLASCMCSNRAVGDYEGPLEDCPVHGKEGAR